MSTLFNFNQPHEFLKNELDRRKQRNQGYSLRAFARDLGISPARLSEILKGAGLSEKTCLGIATCLKLSALEKNYFLDLVLASTARNENVRILARARVEKAQKSNRLKSLQEAEFKIISDWYHGAILELIEMKNFKPDIIWIAEQLGITMATAELAVDRLQRLQLLKIEGLKWIVQPEAFQTFSATPSEAIQKFHQQILKKSVDSIQNDPISDRQIQSMIVAIPKKQLPLFSEKMKLFLQQFWEDLRDSEKDDLYALSLQLTPMRSRSARQKSEK